METLNTCTLENVVRAIRENDCRRLVRLLGHGPSAKLDSGDLDHALQEAVCQGRAECAAALLASGADPNCADAHGRTPLFLLMESGGDPEVLRELLRAGGSPNKVTWSTQQTALHVASRRGYQVALKGLMSAGVRVDPTDHVGNTPLMYAAREGHVTSVRMLLAEGANPNAVNRQMESALHLAVKGGYRDCVEELLDCEADPDLRDSRGQTPLLAAFKSGKLEAVDVLLDFECDVNVQDTQSGKTILHWAIQNATPSLVSRILHQGAASNTRDKAWETPFLLAINLKKLDMLEVLMTHHCDVTVTDKSFNTGLHMASREGFSSLVPRFVESGLDVNLKGSGGVTPLMLACQGGHLETVTVLLSKGANPDTTDRNRATPLIYAVTSSSSKTAVCAVVKCLLRHGCGLDDKTNLSRMLSSNNIPIPKGKVLEKPQYSPLEVAYLCGRPTIFLMLLSAGCKLDDVVDDFLRHGCDVLSVKPMSPRTVQQLVKAVQVRREKVPMLKMLCRRPALRQLNSGGRAGTQKVTLAKDVRKFLEFNELDGIQNILSSSSNDAAGGALNVTSPVEESGHLFNTGTSSFSRDDKRRQTVGAGIPRRKSQPSPFGFRPEKVRNTSISSDDGGDVFQRLENQMGVLQRSKSRPPSETSNKERAVLSTYRESTKIPSAKSTLKSVATSPKVPRRKTNVPMIAQTRPVMSSTPNDLTKNGRRTLRRPRCAPSLTEMLHPDDELVNMTSSMAHAQSWLSTQGQLKYGDSLLLGNGEKAGGVVGGVERDGATPRCVSPTAKDSKDLGQAMGQWKRYTSPLGRDDSRSVQLNMDTGSICSDTGSVDTTRSEPRRGLGDKPRAGSQRSRIPQFRTPTSRGAHKPEVPSPSGVHGHNGSAPSARDKPSTLNTSLGSQTPRGVNKVAVSDQPWRSPGQLRTSTPRASSAKTTRQAAPLSPGGSSKTSPSKAGNSLSSKLHKLQFIRTEDEADPNRNYFMRSRSVRK